MTGPSSPDNPIGVDPARLVAAHRHARAYYRRQLATADGPRRYLTHRGLGPLVPTAAASASVGGDPWQLGYAPPGWTNLVDHLTGLDYTASELLAAGLAIRSCTGGLVDVFRDRIMFPIHDPHCDPIAFTARAPDRAAADVPKYLNTTDTVIYHKGQTLYGLGEQRDRIADCWAPVTVEGPVDVLAVWLAHPPHTGAGRVAVAACGTSVTEHHAATLCALPGAVRYGVTTAFDDDPAGRKATERAWHLLSVHDVDLHAATLPPGTDPGALITTADNIAVLRDALAQHARPLVQAVIDLRLDRLTQRHPDLLTYIEGRFNAARALAELVTDLPAAQILTLATYIAQRTGAGIDTVANIVIANIEAAPGRPIPQRAAQPAKGPPARAGDPDAKPADSRPRRGRTFPPPNTRSTRPAQPAHPVPGVTRPHRTTR